MHGSNQGREQLVHSLEKKIMYEHLMHEISSLMLRADNIRMFLNESIRIIGETLQVSRVYIFEYDYKTDTNSNTFEWVAPGITSEKDNLQNIPAESILWWTEQLKEKEIINYRNIENIPDQVVKDMLAEQHIKSLLVVPLFVDDIYYGFIGFDECHQYRYWPEEDVNVIKSISTIISQFIAYSLVLEKLKFERNQLQSIFDSIPNFIYVADIENNKIIYVNKALKNIFGPDLIGQTCYKVLQGLDEPCEFCTNHIIKELNGKPHTWDFHNSFVKRDFKLIDQVIRWADDREVRFEYGIDITEFKRIEQELLREKERLLQSERYLKESNRQLQDLLESTIAALGSALKEKDMYTAEHQNNVAKLACAIAQEMDVPSETIKGLKVAALLHDIGKISIPLDILNKPGRLTNNEYNLVKDHVKIGYEIVKQIDFPWPIAQIVLQHHERIDGSGYPNGLKGKDLLLESKILAVADTIEAMSSHRPYRPALGIKAAIREITHGKNLLYDEIVVSASINLLSKNSSILSNGQISYICADNY